MRVKRKGIVFVTARPVAAGAIGFAAIVPGLASTLNGPTVGVVGGEHEGAARLERLRDALRPLDDDTTIDAAKTNIAPGAPTESSHGGQPVGWTSMT